MESLRDGPAAGHSLCLSIRHGEAQQTLTLPLLVLNITRAASENGNAGGRTLMEPVTATFACAAKAGACRL